MSEYAVILADESRPAVIYRIVKRVNDLIYLEHDGMTTTRFIEEIWVIA